MQIGVINKINETFLELGRVSINFFICAGEMFLLFLKTIYWCFQPPLNLRGILNQMLSAGTASLPVVAITAILTGMVLAWQAGLFADQFGTKSYVGASVAVGMIRELGPVLTGLMVAGRISSSTTAELGAMKITEQIDALKALAIEPIQFLAVPRFIACIIMMPILVTFADFIGMLGGYFIAVNNLDVTHSVFIDKAIEFVELKDFYYGLIKAVAFGAIIAVVSCYKGLAVSGGATDVGKATTFSVVVSTILILLVNYFLTVLFVVFF
jgi:phospholipid/cholesterol/gamma-HCH transport system permease protein